MRKNEYVLNKGRISTDCYFLITQEKSWRRTICCINTIISIILITLIVNLPLDVVRKYVLLLAFALLVNFIVLLMFCAGKCAVVPAKIRADEDGIYIHVEDVLRHRRELRDVVYECRAPYTVRCHRSSFEIVSKNVSVRPTYRARQAICWQKLCPAGHFKVSFPSKAYGTEVMDTLKSIGEPVR